MISASNNNKHVVNTAKDINRWKRAGKTLRRVPVNKINHQKKVQRAAYQKDEVESKEEEDFHASAFISMTSCKKGKTGKLQTIKNEIAYEVKVYHDKNSYYNNKEGKSKKDDDKTVKFLKTTISYDIAKLDKEINIQKSDKWNEAMLINKPEDKMKAYFNSLKAIEALLDEANGAYAKMKKYKVSP